MLMKIDQIWEQLENDESFTHGLLLRRYSASVLPDVFVALRAPEKFRCIAASISSSISLNLSRLENIKDIRVELVPDEKKPKTNILLFTLVGDQHKDIFSVLCTDLIASISAVTTEPQLVKELLNRFEKWKSLFDRVVANGLTNDEQRGLFGELLFIRKYLQSHRDSLYVINSWVGPERQIRDFQSDCWSVEVKTSHGNNHQRVHISNERQLDTSSLETLLLYHLSLDMRQRSGETLNQVVDSVSEALRSDWAALNRFKNKLLEGGYFEQHKTLYEDVGYFVRGETFYEVRNDFPRIEEKDIRRGVGDVEYSLILAQCSDFIITEDQAFRALVSHEPVN
jgi:hypothetical protein